MCQLTIFFEVAIIFSNLSRLFDVAKLWKQQAVYSSGLELDQLKSEELKQLQQSMRLGLNKIEATIAKV